MLAKGLIEESLKRSWTLVIPWRHHSFRNMSGIIRVRVSKGIDGEIFCEERHWTANNEHNAAFEAIIGGEIADGDEGP